MHAAISPLNLELQYRTFKFKPQSTDAWQASPLVRGDKSKAHPRWDALFEVSRSRSGTTYQVVVSSHLSHLTSEVAEYPSRVFTRRKQYSV
jgi:hypothetical protein